MLYMAEALTLRKASQWILRNLTTDGMVIIDAQLIFFTIRSTKEDWSTFWIIIHDCMEYILLNNADDRKKITNN